MYDLTVLGDSFIYSTNSQMGKKNYIMLNNFNGLYLKLKVIAKENIIGLLVSYISSQPLALSYKPARIHI